MGRWTDGLDKWINGLLDKWIGGLVQRWSGGWMKGTPGEGTGPTGYGSLKIPSGVAAVALLSSMVLTTTPRISQAQQLAATTTPTKSPFEQFLEQDYLLGTWGGLRTKLSEHGVDFEFLYIASNPHNISGGIEPASRYQGAFLMMMDLDSEKLANYPGGHFQVAGASIHGQDHFSDQYIGDRSRSSASPRVANSGISSLQTFTTIAGLRFPSSTRSSSGP